MNRLPGIASSILVAAAALLTGPAVSQAQWVLYDKFSGTLIDHEKWFGNEATGGPQNPTTEIAREIRAGRLRMLLNQHGNDGSDSGTSGGQVRLQMTTPGGVIGMKAKVIVNQANSDECPANVSALVRGRAQVSGAIFNDGTSTGSGDRTGDIVAGVQKILDTKLGMVIQPFLVRCTNSTCGSTAGINPLAPASFVTTWSPGSVDTVSWLWDKTNNRVVYTSTTLVGKEVLEIAYTADDSTPPVLDFKQLSLNHSAANCTGTQTRTFMDASFDGVKVR